MTLSSTQRFSTIRKHFVWEGVVGVWGAVVVSVCVIVKSGITVSFGFTLSNAVDYWCGVGISSGVWYSSNNFVVVVWVSSNSGGVWISRVARVGWVYTVISVV